MPKISKIASGERRNWLELSEQGTSVNKVAKESGRDVRTVRAHIEKARLERNFELAQRDQLRDALHGHQQDMLGLLQNLKGSINVPQLDYFEPVGLDYGLEDLCPCLSITAWHRSVTCEYRSHLTNGAGPKLIT